MLASEPTQTAAAADPTAAALYYASRGWAVLPIWWVKPDGGCACGDETCNSTGKHPLGRLVRHGLLNASTDRATIATWWGRYPQANVGIATGPTSGLVVLDVDPRHQGPEHLAALERRYLPLPSTVEVTSGGGGRHLYFRCGDAALSSEASLLPGVDVRADGGYIVAPPSTHASGRRYCWRPGRGPQERELAALPAWVADLARHRAEPVHGLRRKRPLLPATECDRTTFARLMERARVRPAGREQEMHRCPWHPDEHPSLSVHWGATVFHCFGCEVGGGIGALRRLVGDVAPTRPVEATPPARAAALSPSRWRAVHAPTSRILVGCSAWTDRPLIESGRFYPADATSAEARLRYYATHFPIVEVDATYYGLPSERMTALWAARTPEGFTFDVKAYSLFTGHPTAVRRLPAEIRERLPADLAQKRRLYKHEAPDEIVDRCWSSFIDGLAPLQATGRLGVVVFQFPRWVFPNRRTHAYLEEIRDRLGLYRAAIEFRNDVWMNATNQVTTLALLGDLEFTYVCVDEPQGFRTSVPPIAAATSEIGFVRFHGRDTEMWERTARTAAERFDHYYLSEELEEWVPRIVQLAEQTDELHLIMNTNRLDQGPANARLLARQLHEAGLATARWPLGAGSSAQDGSR